MSPHPEALHPKSPKRIGIISLRDAINHVSKAQQVEFENAVLGFEDAELIVMMANTLDPKWRIGKYVRRWVPSAAVRKISPIAMRMISPRKAVDKDYELLFFSCMNIWELYRLGTLVNWKKRAAKAVCWIFEIWESELNKAVECREYLSEFDAIFTNCRGTVKALEKISGRPVRYAPPGIDAQLFCPLPNPPPRCIYVYSMGRRVAALHEALIKHCDRHGQFYLFDTIPGAFSFCRDLVQHRWLSANLIKRSKYFTVNPGKFDSPDETLGRREIGTRYVEGATGGAVMIGTTPEGFNEYFDWSDAIVEVGADPSNIGAILRELDEDPKRLARMRVAGVTNNLRRNDWVYRWAEILWTAGLPPTGAMQKRMEDLEGLACMMSGQAD